MSGCPATSWSPAARWTPWTMPPWLTRRSTAPSSPLCLRNRRTACLQAEDHVVGYIGDGINDAPSLHTADVGISVMNGVDVAKDAAKIILLEKDLAVLNEGVIEGRRSFANIMKYIIMGTSSNFGNMFS